jgi:hypothetical protein
VGAFTPLDQVWYPDGDDTAEQNVNMAAQASSIEEGIGARLRHQEIAIGLKASPSSAYVITAAVDDASAPVVPVAVGNGPADFGQGITVNSGVATIATAGMYLVTASISTPGGGSQGIVAIIAKNGTPFASSETPISTIYNTNSQATCVINCVPGDTIALRARISGGGGNRGVVNNNQSLNYLSIAMVQALPL